MKAIPFTDAEVRFLATAADEKLGRFLDISAGSPTFTVDRTTWMSGQPVTNVRLYFASGYEMVARYEQRRSLSFCLDREERRVLKDFSLWGA